MTAIDHYWRAVFRAAEGEQFDHDDLAELFYLVASDPACGWEAWHEDVAAVAIITNPRLLDRLVGHPHGKSAWPPNRVQTIIRSSPAPAWAHN